MGIENKYYVNKKDIIDFTDTCFKNFDEYLSFYNMNNKEDLDVSTLISQNCNENVQQEAQGYQDNEGNYLFKGLANVDKAPQEASITLNTYKDSNGNSIKTILPGTSPHFNLLYTLEYNKELDIDQNGEIKGFVRYELKRALNEQGQEKIYISKANGGVLNYLEPSDNGVLPSRFIVVVVSGGGGGCGSYASTGGAGGGGSGLVLGVLPLTNIDTKYILQVGRGGAGGQGYLLGGASGASGKDGKYSQITLNGNIIMQAKPGLGGTSASSPGAGGGEYESNSVLDDYKLFPNGDNYINGTSGGSNDNNGKGVLSQTYYITPSSRAYEINSSKTFGGTYGGYVRDDSGGGGGASPLANGGDSTIFASPPGIFITGDGEEGSGGGGGGYSSGNYVPGGAGGNGCIKIYY